MVQVHHYTCTTTKKYKLAYYRKADAKVQNKSHFLPVEAIKPCFYDSTGMFLQSITHCKLLKINNLQRVHGVFEPQTILGRGCDLEKFFSLIFQKPLPHLCNLRTQSLFLAVYLCPKFLILVVILGRLGRDHLHVCRL